jgi:3-hydroxyisobutyrate dehydrogenase-like beta-hydroxyacid dehydrogenase
MGAALGRLLREAGHRVVTTLEGRGATTGRNSREAGLEQLDTLPALIRTASVLISLVPPPAALPVAVACRDALARESRCGAPLLYADLNSVSPQTARAVAYVFVGTSVEVVDGAILGLASHLQSRGVLYLSGRQAGQVAALVEGKLQVQVLGDEPGQASAMRMLLSGLTKGVLALFVEMALAARQAGVLERLLANCRADYPGVMEVVERVLPTYPRHAARRGQELAEVEATLSELGLSATVVPGVRQLIQAMERCWSAGRHDGNWSVAEVINDLHARQLLQTKGVGEKK